MANPGKFPDATAQKLWDLAGISGQDDECGDVSTVGLWAGLFTRRGGSLPGRSAAYILTEDSQGFVDYESFNSAREARAAFDRLCAELSEGEEEENPRGLVPRTVRRKSQRARRHKSDVGELLLLGGVGFLIWILWLKPKTEATTSP